MSSNLSPKPLTDTSNPPKLDSHTSDLSPNRTEQPEYNDSDIIHHVYFEDNDSFFPPSWLGQHVDPSQRRGSDDSIVSDDPMEYMDKRDSQCPAEKEHLDWGYGELLVYH